MEEAIRNFGEQLRWVPKLDLETKPPSGDGTAKFSKFIVCGMGGSALAAGLLKVYNPALDLLIHRDYGLPRVPEYFLRESLVILSSYSGNTEEVLDTAAAGLKLGLQLAAVTTGGQLLAFARKNNLPYIQLPPAGLQPRLALGYSVRALLRLVGGDQALADLAAVTLDHGVLEGAGAALAQKLADHVPIIYTSTTNWPLAYIWKIKFNETAKIPAFWNVLPELNHNEMTAFADAALGKNFHFIFLTDPADDPRIAKRFSVLCEMYRARDWPVEVVPLANGQVWTKIFNSLILADLTALALARHYGHEPEEVPMVEEFKKLIS